MGHVFDPSDFARRSGEILVHSKGKTFLQLAREIAALRNEYRGLSDKPAKLFVRRNLSRRLLMVALDTDQSPVVIERLYRLNVKDGFNDPAAELASALEYAYYCDNAGRPSQGLHVIRRLRNALSARADLPPHVLSNFYDAIDKCVCRLGTRRRDSD